MRWNEYKLEAVAKLVSGRTPDREQKEYYAKEGIPWVKIENLDQGYITESTEYVSELGKEKVNIVPEQSVLFSIVGTVGKVGIAACRLATNQQIVSLIFDETKVLPMYGYYCLRYHAEDIKKLSNQTTMALISRKTLGQYKIQVPENLELQKEIIEKLQKFEVYAQKKEKLRTQFGTYESVLFWKMFADEIQYHEQLELKEFLSDPINSGFGKNEKLPENSKSIEADAFSAPYLCGSEASDIDKNTGKITYGRTILDDRYLVKDRDILLRNGSLILAEKQENPLYFDRNILCIRTKKTQLLPEVLYAYLSLPRMKHVLYGERKAGDGRKRPIRASELERMKISYFTMEKQTKYAACLRKIRQIEKSLDKEILYAWKVFEIMLQLLLTKEKEKSDKLPASESEEEYIESQKEKKDDEGEGLETLAEQEQISRQRAVSHLILAILCGWCPSDGKTGEYCKKRQEIFRIAQPFFQPVALSFVRGQEQKEYLLERDFLVYHSAVLSARWEQPFDFLKEMLSQLENGEIEDAHLAFQGETGIGTELEWNDEDVERMAGAGLRLLIAYSGLEACDYLLS